jgi:hypothetical protein
MAALDNCGGFSGRRGSVPCPLRASISSGYADPASNPVPVEVALVPAQVHQFGSPQAVPVGHQDHGGVPVTVPVALGCLGQADDLGFGQILAGSQLGIRHPARRNCSIYGGLLDELEMGFRILLRGRGDDFMVWLQDQNAGWGQLRAVYVSIDWTALAQFVLHFGVR